MGGVWPDVSVVIPHYNNPAGLAEVVAGVRAQDYPGRVEIVVADDGSAQLPRVRDAVVVAQEDLGFRAAAARNLGARRATGSVLAFLDGDTVPSPGYLSAVVAHVQRDERAIVVGTRFTGPERAEPGWLADAWARTHHLSDADDTSWRYIISAVLTCSRPFFSELGGFDDSFVGYGGEDWEFGWRAWNSGATFAHEPGATATHAEVDFGKRHPTASEEARVKNVETAALARRVTHPLARPAGVVFDTADVAVVVPDFPVPGVCEAVIASWLRIDAHVYTPAVPPLFAADPRVSAGVPAGERIRVTLRRPWSLTDPVAFYRSATDRSRSLPDGTSSVAARARALASTSEGSRGEEMGLTLLDAPQRLERLFAGW
ncbi:Hyaluronan synthase [Corynebacterium capitovis DSM 44611]|nr:Hyaluronan synthase [Corynebacterium capitovis DSM 44611]